MAPDSWWLNSGEERKLISLDFLPSPADSHRDELSLGTRYEYDDGEPNGIPSRGIYEADDGTAIVSTFRLVTPVPGEEETLEITDAYYESLEAFYLAKFGIPTHPRQACAWCRTMPGRFALTGVEADASSTTVCGPDCTARPGPAEDGVEHENDEDEADEYEEDEEDEDEDDQALMEDPEDLKEQFLIRREWEEWAEMAVSGDGVWPDATDSEEADDLDDTGTTLRELGVETEEF